MGILPFIIFSLFLIVSIKIKFEKIDKILTSDDCGDYNLVPYIEMIT